MSFGFKGSYSRKMNPACGPREDFSPNPPYFRLIEIDKEGRILSAVVMELDGKGGAKEADLPDFWVFRIFYLTPFFTFFHNGF
jgi:hypothetical protein